MKKHVFLGTKTLDPHPVVPGFFTVQCPGIGMVETGGSQDYADLFRELRGDLVNKESEISHPAPEQKPHFWLVVWNIFYFSIDWE